MFKLVKIKVGSSKNKAESKNTAKHYALSYLFELNALGEQLPKNDGGLAQSKLIEIGNDRIGKNGSGFVKAIRELLKYDINSDKQLMNISQNWREKVLALSTHKDEIEKYLKSKNL